MNALLSYLHDNRARLQLARYGLDGEMAYTLLTPRFRASSHVIFLIFAQGQSAPALVAKVPRLTDRPTRLEQEAANLRMLQTLRGQAWASVPALVAFEPFADRAVLVETALVGQPIDPGFVRRAPDRCCTAVVNWLCDVQWPAAQVEQQLGQKDAALFARLVETPYRAFAERFPLTVEEEKLLQASWTWLAPLQELTLPPVFEHGDLSHPNLFLLENGELGIVDWETAQPFGLPACDLFFFLTYVAFSQQQARSTERALAAFRAAFFGGQAWARPYVASYAQRLQLPDRALTPLFILCWLRTLVSLLARLEEDGAGEAPVQPGTANWLRANRFYALWREAVTRAHELAWTGDPSGVWRMAPAGLAAVK